MAGDLAGSGIGVDLLVTIDPVGRSWSMTDASNNTIEWVNVSSNPSTSDGRSDTIAWMGGQWGDWPDGKATSHYQSPFHHLDFEKMFNYQSKNGKSGSNALTVSNYGNNCGCP